MSSVLEVSGGRPLVGTVLVPGDKSISHRALLIGALAEGSSLVRGLSDGEDVAAHRRCGAGNRCDGPPHRRTYGSGKKQRDEDRRRSFAPPETLPAN